MSRQSQKREAKGLQICVKMPSLSGKQAKDNKMMRCYFPSDSQQCSSLKSVNWHPLRVLWNRCRYTGKLTMYIPYAPHRGIFISPVENSSPCEILILSGLGASVAGRGPAWAPCTLQHNQPTPGLETLSYVLQCDVHKLSYVNNAVWGEKDEESLLIPVHKEGGVQRGSWQVCYSSGGEGNRNNLPLCSRCCCELPRCPSFSPEAFMPPSSGSVGC